MDFKDILKMISETTGLNMEKVMCYEAIKDKLRVQLVNKHIYKDIIDEAIHKDFLDDFSIIVVLHLEFKDGKENILGINESLCKIWFKHPDEVIAQAKYNTLQNDIIHYANISDRIIDMTMDNFIPDFMPDFMKDEIRNDIKNSIEADAGELDGYFYVLSNENDHFGATQMLNTKFLLQLTRELNSDLIIVPMSVNEIGIMKSNDCPCLLDIKNMIATGNKECDKMEVLGDKPYIFTQKGNWIIIK